MKTAPQVVTVQQTSKGLKLALALCNLAFALSFAWLLVQLVRMWCGVGGGHPLIAPLVVTGVIVAVRLVVKLLIWWHHG